ncbi:hypothetical protein [Streptomyces sp. NPDC088357]|uniref:hypothetical protein n=1 Tax=Streptomyces sp. NPDC088357 TaxID=3154655 RepID=UPI003447E0DB
MPRRAVLGTALGGVAAAALPGTAHAEQPPRFEQPDVTAWPPCRKAAPGNSATP